MKLFPETESLIETERSRKRKDHEAVADHGVPDTKRAKRTKGKEVIAMTGRVETLLPRSKRSQKIKSELLHNDTTNCYPCICWPLELTLVTN